MNDFVKKLDPKGIASLAVSILVVINQFLSMQGKGPLPIGSDQLNYWVSTGITGVVLLYQYFTKNELLKKDDYTGGGTKNETKK